MKRTTVLVGLVLLGLLLATACSDDNNAPDALIAWFVTLGVEGTASGDLPITFDISATVRSANPSLGLQPDDGTQVRFRTSGGAFTNGSQELTASTVDGVAVATVQFTESGTYTVTAEVDGETGHVVIQVTIG